MLATLEEVKSEAGIFDNFYLRILSHFQTEARSLLEQIDSQCLFNKEQIQRALSLDLKSQLMSYCSNVLIKEFQIWKKTQIHLKTDLYKKYNQLLLEEIEYKKILKAYPVLERLIKNSVQQVLHQLNEVLHHFCKDKAEIEATFQFSLEKLEKLNFLDGDSQNNGRRVMMLLFNDNQKLVYKPHSLSGEESFNRFLRLLNESNDLLYTVKNARVLDKDSYGWQEFIVSRSCSDETEVKKAFYRFGVYGAVFTLLQTSDLHYENIIMQGEYPMFVDLETLVSVLAKQKEKNLLQ